ncbi:MAG: hypothetical protein K0R39_1477 [Symbiobacteriaceae bacterium]|nr:hypothetical protein [Symbiobacteriaceae bacterium]
MNRRFWIIMSGHTISMLGTSFGTIAQAWLVYELTGSKLAMGTVLMMSTLPETLLRLFGGPLVDRFNRIALLRNLNIIQMMVYAIAPALAMAGLLQVWHLYAVAVLAGLSRALYAPAAFSLMPLIVPREQLVRANSLSQSLTTGVGLAGPAMAGALVAAVGPVPAMVLDVVSYGLAALSLVLIPQAVGVVQHRPGARGSYWGEMAAGFRVFRQIPALLVVMLAVAAINFATTANSSMLVPFVREQLGGSATAVGFLGSALTAGNFLGSLAIAWAGDMKRRRLAMMLPLAVSGGTIAALSLLTPGHLTAAAALLVLCGVGLGMFNPQNQALFQRLIPQEMQGRVASIRLTIAWGVMPLSAFLGSLVAERAGLPAMLALFGLVPVVVALLAISSSALRSIDGDAAAGPSPDLRAPRAAGQPST